MTSLTVPGMSCGHCTAAIEKAIKALDPDAEVTCDLGTKRVEVDSDLSDQAVSAAIRNAGYDVAAPRAAS